MSSKNQVVRLVDSLADKFIAALKIKHCSITWQVLHSKSKEAKEVSGEHTTHGSAVTMWNPNKKRNKKYHIVIYYDKQHGKKDAIGSIVHELLHVRMRQWDRVIRPKKANRAHIIEELFIRDLEQIILDLI